MAPAIEAVTSAGGLFWRAVPILREECRAASSRPATLAAKNRSRLFYRISPRLQGDEWIVIALEGRRRYGRAEVINMEVMRKLHYAVYFMRFYPRS